MELKFSVRRDRYSVTQGTATVCCNGEELITYGDDLQLMGGEWRSTKTDAELITTTLFPNELVRSAYPDRVASVQEKIEKIGRGEQ